MNLDPSDAERGLYEKFRVTRLDDSPRHDGCDYFVLDLNHDPHAIPALEAYAESCRESFPVLAEDLDRQLVWMRAGAAS